MGGPPAAKCFVPAPAAKIFTSSTQLQEAKTWFVSTCERKNHFTKKKGRKTLVELSSSPRAIGITHGVCCDFRSQFYFSGGGALQSRTANATCSDHRRSAANLSRDRVEPAPGKIRATGGKKRDQRGATP